MSLAIPYARTQRNLKKNPSLHHALHALRKAQLRCDQAILEHATISVLIKSSKPLCLAHIQIELAEKHRLQVSKNKIRKVVLTPLCKEKCIVQHIEKENPETGSSTSNEKVRLYASTKDLCEYYDKLSNFIILESMRSLP